MTTRPFTVAASGDHTPADPEATGPSRCRRAAAGGAWFAGLVAAVVLLTALGSGPLSTPPLLDRAALQRWVEDRDAVTAAFALVRLLGLGLAWYLLAVTALGLLAGLTRVPALVRAAEVATLPAVRTVLGTAAGIGVTASAAGLVATDGAGERAVSSGPGAAPAAVVIERLPDDAAVVLRRVPDGEGTATMQVEDDELVAPADEGGEWTVQPGDHLWSVAQTTLAAAWERPPDDDEIVPYWRVLVELNRDRLLDPSNPDLVTPGQVLAVPPPPPPPES